MRKRNRNRVNIVGVAIAVCLGMLLLSNSAATNTPIRYQSYNLPSSVVHTLVIPPESQLAVSVALSPELDNIENFAQKHQAIAVLNGGFFDPVNHKTTSYIVQQGQLVADPRLNERLIHNPKLAPYMDRILNRSEFRRYQCGLTIRYEISLHSAAVPAGCKLIGAVGGGPCLLPELTSVQEGFFDVKHGKIIQDAIGSWQPNARTAIGTTRDRSIIWVMVAQKPKLSKSGLSLPALAEFMNSLGVEQAVNLDGGSSSALYYQGKTFYGKLDAQGKTVKRPIKSVLILK